jgi:endoglucanase
MQQGQSRKGQLGVRQFRRVYGLVALGVAAVLVAAAWAPTAEATTTSKAPPVVVKVSGNSLVDGSGNTIRLLGVDRSGTEYACIQGWAIFDGPSDATSIAAIASWHTNAVRIPLNEDCWLGINETSADQAQMGMVYRQAIKAYVKLLHQAGMAAILDLALTAPGKEQATGASLEPMPDQHAVTFWTEVANAFKNDPGVLFDLYNEPNNVDWPCWLSGCKVNDALSPGKTFKAVGMQTLVNAVRATGATEPIMAGGLEYASDLSQWPAGLTDPAGQLVASTHVYNNSNETEAIWDAQLAPIAAAYPIVTGELGETDCADSFVDSYMTWADAHGVSYLGWTWDATDASGFTCAGGPSLIVDYDGTPTPYGLGLQQHLAALASAS